MKKGLENVIKKSILGILVAGFFLLPVSLTLENSHQGVAVRVVENKAEAISWLCALNPGLCAINAAFGTEVKGTETNYTLGCNFFGGKDGLIACVNSVLYFIFSVIALLAQLAGIFLDFFVHYSTNSDSYKGPFIEKGWAVVRDVANLFFIIALLYAAFKIILGDHHSNPKKLISTVIMMALLINFSLFATRVVIDASNILAKIFYNNIASVDNKGNPIPPGPGNEKSISIGLIGKYNPQEIITKSVYEAQGPSTFALVTLILIGLLLYTCYLFFSVGMLFVARVVSLWIAMIFSPLAFASETMPSVPMGDMSWRSWLGNLMSNAFLAPVFVFFLYLIVLFLDIGADIAVYATGSNTFQKIMHVLIPFMILAGLLMKAKEIAVKMSGEMGKTIQGLAAGVGTLALGAATGGAAMLGRQSLGRLATGASTRASKVARYNTERTKFDDKYAEWVKNGSRGDAPSWKEHMEENGVEKISGYDKFAARFAGNKINESQKLIQETNHARHVMDDLNKQVGVAPGTPESRIGAEQKILREKKFAAQERGTIEAAVRKGTDGKKDILLKGKDANGNEAEFKGAENFKITQRQILTDKMINKALEDIAAGEDNKNIDVTLNKKGVEMIESKVEEERTSITKSVISDPAAKDKGYVDNAGNLTALGTKRIDEKIDVKREEEIQKLKTTGLDTYFDRKLSRQGQENLKEELNIVVNEAVNVAVNKETKAKYQHIQTEAATRIGFGDRVAASSTGGTYNAANLESKVDMRDSVPSIILGKVTNAVAVGLRGGLKGQNIDVAKGSHDVFTDLGKSLTSALKKAGNIKLDLGGSGGGGGHGGGHDDHGHGGGHH
jgi:hypothetical protein